MTSGRESEYTFLSEGSKISETIRSSAWSSTPLGPPEQWSQSLRTTVGIVLGARRPQLVAWGPQFAVLYNDAAARMLDSRHPEALGRPMLEVFEQRADELAALLEETSSPRGSRRCRLELFAGVTFICTGVPSENGIGGLMLRATETGPSTIDPEGRTVQRSTSDEELRYLETVLSSTSDLVFVFGLEGRLLYGNEATLERLSYHLDVERDEIVGKTLHEMGYPAAYAERYIRQFQRVAETGEPVRDEVVAPLSTDDESRALEYIFSPIFDDQGDVEAVAGITRDVTELRETAAALEKSEQLYQTLFESVDQGIGILEVLDSEAGEPVDFRWIAANDGFERHSGLSDPVGKTARELTPEADESWFQIYAEVARTGRSVSFENYIEETGRWIEVEAVPVGERESRRVAVLFNDSTEARRRHRNMVVLDELNDVFSRLSDPDEIMEVVSDKLADHLGVSRVTFMQIDESAGSFRSLYDWRREGMLEASGDDRLSALGTERVLENLRAGQGVVVEDVGRDGRTAANAEMFESFDIGSLIYVPHLSDGEWRFQLAVHHSQPYEWRDDEIDLVCDLTDRLWWRLERAYAEQQLREANRRKDEFLATLSHELRNPLAPIEMGLDLLEHGEADSQQGRKAREIIRRQVRQLTRLVDDLLDVNRIDSGKIELEMERIELNEIVGETVRDHEPMLEDRGLTVQFERAEAPVVVEADSNRLAQVVGNLLQNAAKFTDPGDRVDISVSAVRSQRAARIRVADTGHGIDSETLSSLFDPFVQADETRRYTVGGLGLGLSLVEGLVELHGGEVRADSDGLGQGAEFIIDLPLREEAMTSETAAGAGTEPAGGRTILIIEDNADIVEMMTQVLQLEGHRVESALTGVEGLELATELDPDVIICDIGLPEMDGYQIARAIRENPELNPGRLIAISGYARPEDIDESREAGFDCHISKPPDIDELQQYIAESP